MPRAAAIPLRRRATDHAQRVRSPQLRAEHALDAPRIGGASALLVLLHHLNIQPVEYLDMFLSLVHVQSLHLWVQ